MHIDDRIRSNLALLYGASEAEGIWRRLRAMLDQCCPDGPAPVADQEPLTQRDAILITYGDTFRRAGQPHLQTLAQFLRQHLPGSFSGLHVLPFYPASSDDGFSVIDYRQVDPALGGWEDVAALGGDYRMMFDAVINHISQQSAWFQAFLRDEPHYRQYFITPPPAWDLSRVVRPRALPLLTPVDTANGERAVWTTFSADQIDLNYANPDVLLEMIALLLFYVARGASILRLDAIAYLWKEPGTSCIHLPQTHAVIKILRAVLDLVAPHVLLITETNVPHRENISYFGERLEEIGRTDEAQLVYQFPLAPLVLHTFASADAGRLNAWVATLDAPGPFFNFIASHDGIGVQPAYGLLGTAEIQALVDRAVAHGGHVSYKANPDGTRSPYELNITLFDALNDPAHPNPELDERRFLASQVIMLSLAGVPGVYVHSLFGSGNCHACVEATGRARSINRASFDATALEEELASPGGRSARILLAYRHLLRARAGQPAFHPEGPQAVLPLGPALFALARFSPRRSDAAVCLVNVTALPQRAHLDLHASGLQASGVWHDLIGGQDYQPSGGHLHVELGAYQSLWLVAGPRP